MEHFVNSFPGREIMINGEKFLYFGGTAYLGLQTDPEFQEIHIKNIRKFGTNYGASRKSNVKISIYEEAEDHLAKLIGSESCLTLSSGFMAGQLIALYLNKKGHKCFYAPETHEAVHSFGSENYKDHESLILEINRVAEKEVLPPVLFSDSISLDGKNYPDFNWLKDLPLQKIILVVDDSHGLGIVGNNGGGVFKSLEKVKSKELIVCGSLGKGFGIQAGVIAGSDHLMGGLKSTDIFAAASPASPASLATLIDSSEILSKKRIALKNNIEYFIKCLNNLKALDYIADYPSFGVNDEKTSQNLLASNIIITNFKYPTEKDDVVQRIVLSAHHTKQDIERLVMAIVTD